MNLTKKISAITAAVIAFTMLAACGKAAPDEAQTEAPAETAVTSAPAELSLQKSVIPTVERHEYDIPQNAALEFTQNMRLGWNIGNTLDATDDSGVLADDLSLESACVGPKKTPELINSMKPAGFNTILVPISWHYHVVENYTVYEPFMNRINEVVDYVIANDMYCIINIHHDIDKDYYYPDNEHLESSQKYTEAIWKQLSQRFADYGDQLIFEGINEPRLKGTGLEWTGNTNSEKGVEAIECINKLNQTFVDTVRASGGNNAERYLMVPGYAAAPDGALTELFKLPDDTADNRIIVSVHAYTPYNFALQEVGGGGSTEAWSMDDPASTSPINDFMDRLYEKFISKGTPVVIGEFGARNKKENLQARVDFAAYYVAAARDRGITCCWWDNNAFFGQGENFGLFDRTGYKWRYGDIVVAMNEYAE